MDNTQKNKLYKMAISDFCNFAFLTPKIPKNHFFRKMITKSKIFTIFKKNRICVVELTVFNQCAKFQLDTIIFDPQKGCFSLAHSA